MPPPLSVYIPYTIKSKLDPCHLSPNNGCFLGHSLRGEKEDLINRFALFLPSEGRRSVGGQKLLFLQYISRVIEGGSIVLTEREIRHALEDQDYWSDLGSGCRLPGQSGLTHRRAYILKPSHFPKHLSFYFFNRAFHLVCFVFSFRPRHVLKRESSPG